MQIVTSSAPQLQQLARLVTGEPRAALQRLLLLVCEQLAMDVAFVATVTPSGQRTLKLAVTAQGEPVPGAENRSEPLAETWCGQVVDHGSLLVQDVQGHPDLLALTSTPDLGIVSYAGVPVHGPDGAVVGTLCALGYEAHDGLTPRDRGVLQGLAEVVAPLLCMLDQPSVPVRRRSPDLAGVAETVTRADTVEALSRPLLDALHDLTGLASAYLTVVTDDTQEIRYSLNTRPGFALTEGLLVPWEDTLCKRSLDEGRPCTEEVPRVWGDVQSAADLGLQVYVSVPVELADGRLWGTLCAADSESADGISAHLPTMRLFARLIAAEVERDAVMAKERARSVRARHEADTDPLTRCASRRVVEPWLATQLDDLADHEAVLVLYADLDAFKRVNDELGHAAGDAVLAEVGRRLLATARPDDLVARLGGDEFLVAARLPRHTAAIVQARVRAAAEFEMSWQQQSWPLRLSVGAALSAGHTPRALLAAADAAMYADKRRARV